jgi:thymidylate synthase (FAD)
MQIIKPSFEIQDYGFEYDIYRALELAGRICYKSEDQNPSGIMQKSADFVAKRLRQGHESIIEHKSITVKFICDRGVSHEIVRHRLCSFSQESTRYCNYSKKGMTFILPPWVDDSLLGEWQQGLKLREIPQPEKEQDHIWWTVCYAIEGHYNNLIEDDWSPQQARSVLPNSLKTEIVVTANLRQWREVFRQRTAKVAHPQMRELMCPLLDKLKKDLPVIFGDISYE